MTRNLAPHRGRQTLSPELILNSLHTTLLLNEVINDLGRLFVLQLGLGDAAHVE